MKTEPKKTVLMEQKNERQSAQQIISLQSYGVNIAIVFRGKFNFEQIEKIKKRLSQSLTNEFKLTESDEYEHIFYVTKNDSFFGLQKNREEIGENVKFETLIETLESKVRITIAEFAVGKVFLHAGVVAIEGKAIVIPAKSYQGKTTLVAELIRKGAVYYSDEYAVLDENGLVHPFPKMLSVRGIVDEYAQKDLPVEDFGGVCGTEPVPVALVLITEYQKGAKWKPVNLSNGQGIMEILPHTIPIRNKPEFTLNVLNNVAERAIITKTKRAEADVTAGLLISFFEKQAFKI